MRGRTNGHIESDHPALNLLPCLGEAWQGWASEGPGLGEQVHVSVGGGDASWALAVLEVWPGGALGFVPSSGDPPPPSVCRVLPTYPLALPPQGKLLGTPLPSLPVACLLIASRAGAGRPLQWIGRLAGQQLSLVLLYLSAFPPHQFPAEGRGGSPGTKTSPSGEEVPAPSGFPALGWGWSVPLPLVADGALCPVGTP